ncbi:MAG: PP2C family protein-serine/threonine phosphatase [Bernardetiaceae bacterium]
MYATWKRQWHSISHQGVRPDQEDSLQKSIMLSNRLSLVLSLIFLLGVVISFGQLRDKEVVFFFLLMTLLSASVPFFNQRGWTEFSRVFQSVIVPVSILVEVLYAKATHASYLDISFYYLPRFLILASLILPLVLLDVRHRAEFWGSIGVVVLCLLVYDPLHAYLGIGYAESVLEQKNPLLQVSIDIVVIVLFVSGFVFLKNINIHFEEQLEVLFEDVQQSNQILQEKQSQLRLAFKELTEKNEKITDSLRYAQNIQESILPRQDSIRAVFQDYFVIYRPKDMVSGDFYWLDIATAEETGTKDKVFVGVVDCTGHGVPGAFMSMTGNTLLHEVIDKLHVYDPSQVLQIMDERLQTTFKDRQNRYHGMDISLCLIEKADADNFHVLYSGAKRPLFYYIPDSQTIKMIRGINKSIGDRHRRKKARHFETHQLLLPKGTVLYLSSDGLVDQGNPAGEKFGTPRLFTHLTQQGHRPLPEQLHALEQALDQHQGKAIQRDDITFLAIQL